MDMITRLITRARKIAGTPDKAARMEDLMAQAYQAGRRAAIQDILITLDDDMLTDQHLDHLGATQMIRANF
jgi:hypothetical protein